jgi:Flp pilus assembly pilin Flp
VGFAAGGIRFTVFLDFFCNTQGNSGVIQNGDVYRDASVSVGCRKLEDGYNSQPEWMDGMLKGIKKTLSALHSDEQGADMVEYILIIAAIGLPLLAVVIWFWHDISKQANEWWEAIKGDQGADSTSDPSDLS